MISTLIDARTARPPATRCAPLLLLAALTPGCGGDAPASATGAVRDTLSDGTVVARHASLPSAPEATLQPDLRIGALEGEAHETFGNVRGVEVTADGELWILDYQAAEIRAFAPDGSFRGVIASRGEGPGELMEANGMIRGPDGTIWVKDHRRWALVGFSPGGEELVRLPTVTRSYGYIWDGAVDDDGVFWKPTGHSDAYQRPTETGVVEYSGRSYYKSFDPRTETYDSLYLGDYASRSFAVISANAGSFFGLPYAPANLTAFDPSGYIWSARSDDYALARIDAANGDTALVVEAELEGPQVTAEDREAWLVRLDRFGEEQAARIRSQLEPFFPERKPVLAALSVDDEGRLWVRRTGSGDEPPIYDVYDREGERLATLGLPFTPAPGLEPVVRAGRLYAATLDELDVAYVVGAPLPELSGRR